jgi:DNA-binding PadR family transcriptional regulator
MKSELVRGPVDLLVLSILRTGAAHGYAIKGELSEHRGEAGTIYPALQRLERDGPDSSGWDAPSGPRRRLHTLTSKGRSAFTARDTEGRQFAASVDSVLRWKS